MTDPMTAIGWGIQLSKLWLASGQEFPVRARDLALEVTKARFEEPVGLVIPHGIEGIDGMLSKRQKKKDWCISFDENVTVQGRINFTIAHELGHYLLHRGQKDSFQCGQMQLLEYGSPESRKIEVQANTFAAYLLMPRNDFEAQMTGETMSFELLGVCAERYGTSLTATALRWLEFTNVAAMLVVADLDKFVRWSYCSDLARKCGAFKAFGEELPIEVVERIGYGRDARRVVPPGVWHASEEAIESLIVSDQFEQLIFLVEFPSMSLVVHEDDPEVDSFTPFETGDNKLRWGK